MSAAHAGTALATYGIDFIYEDDAGTILLSRSEEISYTRGTHAYEHLHKIGARYGEEGNLSLSGYGSCKQGFTGTGRAHHQNAARNTTAQL